MKASEHKEQGKKKTTKWTTTKRSKSTQDIHKTCAALQHSKLKLERVWVISWFSESWMKSNDVKWVSPLSSNGAGMLISRITAQEEKRDSPGKVPNQKPSVSFLNIHLKKKQQSCIKRTLLTQKQRKKTYCSALKLSTWYKLEPGYFIFWVHCPWRLAWPSQVTNQVCYRCKYDRRLHTGQPGCCVTSQSPAAHRHNHIASISQLAWWSAVASVLTGRRGKCLCTSQLPYYIWFSVIKDSHGSQ